jgi:5-methylcytosine-specific restriction enzyme B
MVCLTKMPLAEALDVLAPEPSLSAGQTSSSNTEKIAETALPKQQEAPPQPAYTVDMFSEDIGFSHDTIQGWQARLLRKRQIILQGPPGTGKTFIAERLARLLVSQTQGSWDIVQFHPSYGYEDFMLGIRPRIVAGQLTYEPEDGRFVEFCERARTAPDATPFILIIDEINRADLSRVFGELMYLLEYRGKEIPLASGRKFQIPNNVYLIGTMNTADRSIALVDHALRRRFSFVHLGPDYDVLRQQHLTANGVPGESLPAVLQDINRLIDDRNYEIGVSFFMKDGPDLRMALKDIWLGEIEPYLEEYFFDQPSKVEAFRWRTLIKERLADWAQ